MSNELDDLAEEWISQKELERLVTDKRRMIEDRLTALLALKEGAEGTETAKTEQGFIIKTVGRLNRKIDADKLQDIATEHGLTEHLSKLFRWSPDIDARAWKSADEAITRPLLGAITTTPGRFSYTITRKDSK
jgi:hypothetical protein